MCTFVERNNFGRLLFCAKHPTPQLVQTLLSSSGPPLTRGFTSTTTTTFKHAWVENLLNVQGVESEFEYMNMVNTPTRLMRPQPTIRVIPLNVSDTMLPKMLCLSKKKLLLWGEDLASKILDFGLYLRLGSKRWEHCPVWAYKDFQKARIFRMMVGLAWQGFLWLRHTVFC